MSLKQMLKKIAIQAACLVCPKNVIVFESIPDFADNTFPVYEELVKRGFADRYTMVWSCGKRQKLENAPKSVRYIYPLEKGLWQKIRNFAYLSAAKCMVCCNRYLLTKRKEQVSFYLSHGTPMKSVRNYYTIPEGIQYCIAAAPGVEALFAYEFRVDPDRVFGLGFPRNDVLTQDHWNVKGMLETDCGKVIVWYPTFRQHKNGMQTSGNPLPIIHDAQAASKLNEKAKALGVLLVLKPHFAQDLRYMKNLDLSNIRFIDDTFFKTHRITSYQFVAGCDALLTDYSSIYFDYMLCDKPIGLVWEDVEDYRTNPGFAVDLEQYGAGGVRIDTLEDFERFLEEVATDVDRCRQKRRELCAVVNYSTDGQNSARVADFVIEKANL